MLPILAIENVVKIYGTNANKTMAVNNVSLTINESEVVAIIGRSGSGKSTLLHMAGLLDRVTSGVIFFKGTDVTTFNESQRATLRREKIGFIFQNFNLLPEYSIRDNICMTLMLNNKKINSDTLLELADLLGLKSLLDKQPFQLSGGEQQRVAIARAFMSDPEVILADEPTGNLDKVNGEKVMDYILKAAKVYHKTVVFVTHDLSLAARADRIVSMSDGKIIVDPTLLDV